MPESVDLQLQSQGVFSSILWTTVLDAMSEQQASCLADIDRLLPKRGGLDPGWQTAPVLQEQPGQHWARLFTLLQELVTAIAGSSLVAPRTLTAISSWAVRFDGPGDWDRAPWTHHSHYPSTFSSVLWLQLPPELVDAGAGGTEFGDPIRFVTRQFRPSVFAYHPEQELQCVIFPSYLEHRPASLPEGIGAPWSCPRVTIATDFFFS